MNKPTIPTAEEFWELTSPNEEFGMLAELKKIKLHKHVFESMRRFAKLHVEAALKCAAENADMTISIESGYVGDSEEHSKEITYHENCGGSRYYTDNKAVVNKESILNSYDLNNIK